MQNKDFTTTILVDKSAKEVFNAINKPQNWWSGEFTGSTQKLHDVFTYRYKEFHFSKQEVAELVPNKKVVWLVTDSTLSFIENKNEWTGTRMIFEITGQDNKTLLRFTHEGLQPGVECFDSCSTAWTQLIQQSLFDYISTGKNEKPVLA
jgi:hypothetical protein